MSRATEIASSPPLKDVEIRGLLRLYFLPGIFPSAELTCSLVHMKFPLPSLPPLTPSIPSVHSPFLRLDEHTVQYATSTEPSNHFIRLP